MEEILEKKAQCPKCLGYNVHYKEGCLDCKAKAIRCLDIGPGDNPLGKNWETLDIVGNPTIKADLCKPLPIEDNTYNIIYISHVLEHIPWYLIPDVLKELYRILKPNGVIEVWVPDMDKIILGYLNPTVIGLDYFKHITKDIKDPTVWFCYRTYCYSTDRDNIEEGRFHKGCFNSRLLFRRLDEAGFKNIKFLDKPKGYDHGFINLGMSGTK